jgi:hypothetical protein
VLVLDGCNTVTDVVAFKNASWPGVKPGPGVQASHSLERARPDVDTDDCAADFADEPVPTPGVSLPLAAVADGAAAGVLRWATPAPNPSAGAVALSLQLARATCVRVDVLDVSGRRLRTLVRSEDAAAGEFRIRWDGRDERGIRVGTGLYFVRARTPLGSRTVRVEIVR